MSLHSRAGECRIELERRQPFDVEALEVFVRVSKDYDVAVTVDTNCLVTFV